MSLNQGHQMKDAGEHVFVLPAEGGDENTHDMLGPTHGLFSFT